MIRGWGAAGWGPPQDDGAVDRGAACSVQGLQGGIREAEEEAGWGPGAARKKKTAKEKAV